MKTLAKVLLLAVGMAVVALPAVQAAETTDQPAPAAHHPARAQKMRRAMFRKIARHLQLTQDQIAKIRAIRTEQGATLKAIRADATLTPDQKKAKFKETMTSTRNNVRALLTPEQQAKWDKMQQRLWMRAMRGPI